MDHLKVAILIPVAVMTAALAYCYNATESYFMVLKVLVDQAYHHPAFWFCTLFTFRYLRFFVHLFSVWVLYKPSSIPDEPDFVPSDCTVILPTVEPSNPDFKECLESCLKNAPGEIIIVTVGRMVSACRDIAEPYRTAWPNTNIRVFRSEIANKRAQVALAIPFVQTRIIVLLDDHVFWPSLNFLRAALAPFEDENVGAVGTNKRVRRTDLGFNMRAFFNMMGAIYLERHNYEIKATNAIDGGIFVLSGRTSLIRAQIIQDPAFIKEFTNERFFFDKFGPLNADDDNCITRWLVRLGWDLKIQASDDAMIETTLGTYPRFLSQCLRWARTTWRSNSASLFTDRTVWYRQPWCVYAVYITSFFNFALFGDALLIVTLMRSPFGTQQAVYAMMAFIFATKLVKLLPYLIRNPQDIIMLPGYFIFAYLHSFLKLWAGITFYVTVWGGRDLGALDTTAFELGDNEIDDDAGSHQDDDDDSDDSHNDDNNMSHGGSIGSRPRHQPPSGRDTSHSSHDSAFSSSRSSSSNSRRSTGTPWGEVTVRNAYRVPANVLQSQYSSPKSRSNGSSAPNVIFSDQSDTSSETDDYPDPSDHVNFSSISTDPYVELDSPLDYQYIMNSGSNLHSPALIATPLTPAFSDGIIKPAPAPIPQHHPAPLPAAPKTKTDFLRQQYSRDWVRGSQCERLHYDGKKLNKTTAACLAESTWGLPRDVVAGRARF